MKKLIALLTALLLALLLMAPGLAEETAQSAEETAQTVEAATEETADTVEEVAEVTTEASVEAEEAAEAPAVPGIIKKLLEVPWYVWVILAVLVILAVVLLTSSRKSGWSSRRIAMGAMCIAIAFVLSCIRLYRMPQGGSITPASMLPLVLFMVACGPVQGFAVGCAFGLLKLIADPYIIHPVQMLVDYPLAYAVMILGCLVYTIMGANSNNRVFRLTDKNSNTTGYVEKMPALYRFRLPLAALLAGIARYLMSVLSGAIFFAEYAGEQNAWIYSLVYNISYMGPDIAVCVLVACIPGMNRLVDMIRKRN